MHHIDTNDEDITLEDQIINDLLTKEHHLIPDLLYKLHHIYGRPFLAEIYNFLERRITVIEYEIEQHFKIATTALLPKRKLKATIDTVIKKELLEDYLQLSNMMIAELKPNIIKP